MLDDCTPLGEQVLRLSHMIGYLNLFFQKSGVSHSLEVSTSPKRAAHVESTRVSSFFFFFLIFAKVADEAL